MSAVKAKHPREMLLLSAARAQLSRVYCRERTASVTSNIPRLTRRDQSLPFAPGYSGPKAPPQLLPAALPPPQPPMSPVPGQSPAAAAPATRGRHKEHPVSTPRATQLRRPTAETGEFAQRPRVDGRRRQPIATCHNAAATVARRRCDSSATPPRQEGREEECRQLCRRLMVQKRRHKLWLRPGNYLCQGGERCRGRIRLASSAPGPIKSTGPRFIALPSRHSGGSRTFHSGPPICFVLLQYRWEFDEMAGRVGDRGLPIFSPNSSPPHEAGSKSIPPQIQNLMGQPPQSKNCFYGYRVKIN